MCRFLTLGGGDKRALYWRALADQHDDENQHQRLLSICFDGKTKWSTPFSIHEFGTFHVKLTTNRGQVRMMT